MPVRNVVTTTLTNDSLTIRDLIRNTATSFCYSAAPRTLEPTIRIPVKIDCRFVPTHANGLL
jgi:hypothetical protein